MNDQQPTDNFSAAFILSLAAALVEVVREAVPVHSSAGNRLARAAEATEKAIEYIPRDADPFPPMFLASEFLPMITARIQSAVVHSGWRRGEKDLDRFFQDMLARINDPKNAAKGDYHDLPWLLLRDKLEEEKGELIAEIWAMSMGNAVAPALIREAADLAVIAMFCAVKAAEIQSSAGEIETPFGI
jgi:hypothetical protein